MRSRAPWRPRSKDPRIGRPGLAPVGAPGTVTSTSPCRLHPDLGGHRRRGELGAQLDRLADELDPQRFELLGDVAVADGARQPEAALGLLEEIIGIPHGHPLRNMVPVPPPARSEALRAPHRGRKPNSYLWRLCDRGGPGCHRPAGASHRARAMGPPCPGDPVASDQAGRALPIENTVVTGWPAYAGHDTLRDATQ